jgi:sugar phosphate isomerase/epimerase
MQQILRLAAYLHEAGEDKQEAANTLKDLDIKYVAIKSSRYKSADEIHNLKPLLSDNNLTPILLKSAVGYQIPPLLSASQAIDTFNTAQYLGISHLALGLGIKIQVPPSVIDQSSLAAIQLATNSAQDQISTWVAVVNKLALDYNITPVYEITNECWYYNHIETIIKLISGTKWRLLYNPSQYLYKSNIDTYEHYYKTLKRHVDVISLQDYKHGFGCRPVGYGDAKIEKIINDCQVNNYRGWFVLEPMLGYRYGEALTRSQTFRLAYQSLQDLLTNG